MSYKCTPEMHLRCSNSSLCHLCDGKSLFRDPRQEKIERERNQKERKYKKRKLGMEFEQKVVTSWNKQMNGGKKKSNMLPRIQLPDERPEEEAQKPYSPPRRVKEEARRQFNSGAFWHSKGDIKLEHALMECKERGTTNSRGEKQITIQKNWLEKQEREAFQEHRDFWYLTFRFKGDDRIYVIKPFDHEMELIYELRKAREEIEKLERRIKELEHRNEDG
mgnify:CR=1 FL=1